MAIAPTLQDHVGWVDPCAVSHAVASAARKPRAESMFRQNAWRNRSSWLTTIDALWALRRRRVTSCPGKPPEEMKRKLRLASEAERPSLFAHCERGTISAWGRACGIDTFIDDSVAEVRDYEDLVRMRGEECLLVICEQSRAHSA